MSLLLSRAAYHSFFDLLLDGISRGWPAILSGLKSMLEKGEALAIPPAALGIESFA